MSKFYCKLLCFFALAPLSSLQVEVAAKGAILMNAESGAVLWEKNAHMLLYPASTTKMITALYALEKKGEGALDELVEASSDAIAAVPAAVRRKGTSHPPYRLEFGGTHIGIQKGEILPLRSLLYGLMLASGNDAANVIAEHVSGDVSSFMQELNAFVQGKGCKNTVLHTPHGLPCDEHKTTAYDMALLAREFLKQEALCQIASMRQALRPTTNKQIESVLSQHNALVRPGRFHYPKAFGIKTGYTVAAGYCIVTAASDENRKLIAVLLGCDRLEQRYQGAIALFEAAFQEKKVGRPLFSKGFDLFTCPLEGGKTPLQAELSSDLVLEYYPSEEPTVKTQICWDHPILPIRAGAQVGSLRVLSSQGKLLLSAPLVATKDVEPTLRYKTRLLLSQMPRSLPLILLGGSVLACTCYRAHRRKQSPVK